MNANVTNLKNGVWETPDTSDLNFQFDIGDSVLGEFILSPNLSAVLKELISTIGQSFIRRGAFLLTHRTSFPALFERVADSRLWRRAFVRRAAAASCGGAL